jgi:hypothetical protein
MLGNNARHLMSSPEYWELLHNMTKAQLTLQIMLGLASSAQE